MEALFSEENLLREDLETEVKRALGKNGKGELPKDFWKTYSAFANTEGGVVLLGVEEKKGGSKEPSLEDLTSRSYNKDAETGSLTPSSYNKDAETGDLTISSYNKNRDHLNKSPSPEEIVVLVREKKRAPRELVKSAILIICSQNYISAGKIANLTNRSVSNIRQHYIKPMLEEGLLERRFPQQPNHENQAYRTRSSGGNSHE